jgi:ATP-dependent RNA helicase DDX5/DBP2
MEPPPFEKDFYMEHPSVAARSSSEIEAYRRDQRITVSDRRAPKPVRTFLEAAFPEFLTCDLEASGFGAPTPIQSQAWPVALSGLDMVGLASTGSGKTLAFALPALVHINAQVHLAAGDGPIVVMLAPTRELALQIKGECDKFGASSGVKNTCVYGGVPKGPQLRDLQHGVEICIATPGRLLDFIDAGQTNLRRTTFLVCDEADRMLDLGFEPQLRRIIETVRPDRQTLMFSATWPREVEKLARTYLEHHVKVQVNNASQLTANTSIEQHFEVTNEAEKHGRYLQVLRAVSESGERIITFCASKKNCEILRAGLKRSGATAEALHGDKSQQERDWAMLQFRNGACTHLIATDVASRGLDVKGVRAVINYDAPGQAEDYVHRIGRAGRAGEKGESYTFFTHADEPVARDIERVLRRSGGPVPRELQHFCQGRGGDAQHNQNRRWR